MITDAADGRFPLPDGGWHRVEPWRTGVEAVLAFSGHSVLALDASVPDSLLVGVDGLGGANHPAVLVALAGAGWIDSLDALLVSRAVPGAAALVDRPDLVDHPRVRFAAAVRGDVRVLGRPDPASTSVAAVSCGIGGLSELSVELDESERGQGGAAAFITAAMSAVPAGEVVVAAVAPGNAVSMRAFVRAGFDLIGSVQLFRPDRDRYPDPVS